MIAQAIQITEIRNEHDVTAHGDTFAVDYGRVNGLVADQPTAEELLEVAVKARAVVVRLKRRGNSATWRAASTDSMVATRAYAVRAGLSLQEAAERVAVRNYR